MWQQLESQLKEYIWFTFRNSVVLVTDGQEKQTWNRSECPALDLAPTSCFRRLNHFLMSADERFIWFRWAEDGATSEMILERVFLFFTFNKLWTFCRLCSRYFYLVFRDFPPGRSHSSTSSLCRRNSRRRGLYPSVDDEFSSSRFVHPDIHLTLHISGVWSPINAR